MKKKNKKSAVKTKGKTEKKVVKSVLSAKPKKEFPKNFPFWARLKIEKHRPTLVIDEDKAYDKQKKKDVDGYVHREVIHLSDEKKKDKKYIKNLEQISPNPDKKDHKDMYLKRPKSTPKKLFMPHDQDWDMPKSLKERYDKNNRKDKK